MSLSTSTVVFLLSLTAVPISFVVNFSAQTLGEVGLLVSGTSSLVGLCVIVYFVIKSSTLANEPLLYVFMLGTFSSACDILLALENDGIINGFFSYYLKDGEPYLKSAHGTMICYWDGIAHYAMYLMMLTALSWNQNFREVGLYWSGSIAHSILVFIPGNLIGKHEVKPSFLLNLPYIVFPFVCAGRFLKERPVNIIPKRLNISIYKRPIDFFLIIATVVCLVFTLFRSLITLGLNHNFSKIYLEQYEPYITDPHTYGKMQMFVHFFYFVPLFIIAIYCLLYPSQSYFPDWALLLAGATAQGQFSYIGSSIHHRTPFPLRVPLTDFHRYHFWFFNLLLLIIPQLLAWRCQNNLDFFAQTTKDAPRLSRQLSNRLKSE